MKAMASINPRVLVGKVTATASGTGGKVRCTLANHGLATGNRVLIDGVLGTTEANGYRTITYVDANNFDLDGTTYANTFTGEGFCYKIQVVKAVLGASSTTFVARFETRLFGSGIVSDSKSIVKAISNTSVEILRSDPSYVTLLDFIKFNHDDSTARVVTVSIENFDVVEKLCNVSASQYEQITSGAGGNQILSADGRTASGGVLIP